MVKRIVYMPYDKPPYVREFSISFEWNKGFALSQKQKNIMALHHRFKKIFPESNVLEISSKSLQELGIKLSAFNLTKFVPSLQKKIPVECVFQGGKVFSKGGPYTDLYLVSSKEAKKEERLKTSGELKNFYFEKETMPLFPKTIFYDWLYMNALIENNVYIGELIKYNAFTDIEFNPSKSINCQARAAALFVSLYKLKKIENCKDFNSFYKIINNEK